eukprot:TRINITY_DN8600_c0_g1_i1.p1 TRINITY_DN8600_c0_g1~~TRINITY_DN8600_c0_g1_i1.p1  ORF type:complete len:303 (-),score=50.99 TRINITY_DN8600_c0_g1_i1:406-1314(-)
MPWRATATPPPVTDSAATTTVQRTPATAFRTALRRGTHAHATSLGDFDACSGGGADNSRTPSNSGSSVIAAAKRMRLAAPVDLDSDGEDEIADKPDNSKSSSTAEATFTSSSTLETVVTGSTVVSTPPSPSTTDDRVGLCDGLTDHVAAANAKGVAAAASSAASIVTSDTTSYHSRRVAPRIEQADASFRPQRVVHGNAAAIEEAASVAFSVIAGSAAPDSTAVSTVITVDALRAALDRYRVPHEACSLEETEAMLQLAATRYRRGGDEVACGGQGVSLGRESFSALIRDLRLQVTSGGRVW